MSSEENVVTVSEVADLLHQQYAIITGGKSRRGFPLITFPDQGNFTNLNDADYQKLVLYLTSVPSMQEADMGFVLIIDRRNDKWSSVKTTLLKISAFFPGVLKVAYVIRPSGFIQKAISEVSNKLFKEEFRFRVVVCSCVEELHQDIDKSELTADLEGTMPYCHSHWIQQRIALEQFSCQTRAVSLSLDDFTRRLRDSAAELSTGATLEVAQTLLVAQGDEYAKLKEQILQAAQRGESLLGDIRQRLSQTATQEPSSLANITAVERLLVQLEETERTFDEFWQQHSARLHQYLELKNFEQDFKSIQTTLDRHLKTVSELTEVGETVDRVDTLIKELVAFQKLCVSEVEKAEELVSSGERLLRGRHYLHLDCVAPKCEELQRMSVTLADRLQRRSEFLSKCRELQESVDKANKWCAHGIDLLASQHIEKCSCSADTAEAALAELEAFMASASQFKVSSPREFHTLFQDSITPETKALVSQVLQRIDDVTTMCDKRLSSLKRLTTKPPRPIQTVTPEPGVPFQTPLATKKPLTASDLSGGLPDTMISKRNHVLRELLETERVYVSELGSVLTGYKYPMSQEEMKSLLPSVLEGKADVLFGNLEELYRFHGEVFLKDLENCISTTELVALCFTHRKESFYRLYSYYCQNNQRSERLRASLSDNAFFVTCQRKLGHKLPLAAYLLKPVQRITKYQLLLKDLLHYSEGQKWCEELQEALDCMLVVLKCVNDSMHQVAITGYWEDLTELGELLMQGSFSVWPESKKDRLRDLRLKPMQRHIFLYQKALMFCKKSAAHNRATYHFKRILKMSQVGLTETVKGDGRSFEVWLQGRQEVHIIQAATVQQKSLWVEQIKKLLLDQLTELKIKQFKSQHLPLRQTCSLDSTQSLVPNRTLSVDESVSPSPAPSQQVDDDTAWSSDYTNSEEDEPPTDHGGKFTALADYCAVGHSEVNMREGDIVELLKVGCAGWWYVKHIGGGGEEGWVPAAYLEHCSRKTSRSSQSVSSQVSSNE